jgi:ribosome assembly protein YihI (activator of Der GTPase)
VIRHDPRVGSRSKAPYILSTSRQPMKQSINIAPADETSLKRERRNNSWFAL